jgi:hypothetical protein
LTENPHLTPQCPGIGEALVSQLVTGSLRPGMMAGGTFILLKAGRFWPESAKRPKICLAGLLKILQIGHPEGRTVPKANAMVARVSISARYG